jgi:hypothetical protein
MKAFTLYELIITIFVLTLLFSISFKTPVFQKNIYYLSQETVRLANFLRLTKDVSLSAISLNNKNLCASGLKFENNNVYKGVAYLTEEDDCEFLFKNRPERFASTNAYVLKDGSLSQNQADLWINQRFDGSFSLSDCKKNPLGPDVLVLFIHPYGESALYIKRGNEWIFVEENLWKEFCIDLKYRNEEKRIKINKLGQILFE